ncbi:MAG: hypothetical protein ACJZ3C_04265 [Pelagibacteraceae bacterium]|tara:strand:- start:67 stop:780 length:714 start_codon:yes stop_codon:yes gene_type:complete
MKRLKFKGKKIEKNKFKGEETLTVKNNVVIDEFNQEYDGFVDVDTGRPHGEGTLTVRKKDKTLWKIEEGIFQDGRLTEGSETTYCLHDDRNFIKKEIGKWRFDKDKNFCEEFMSGKGEELYYRTEKDLKDNKYFGYVKGIFDDGSLLKGEVYNAYLIEYSDADFVKKIIVKGKSKDYLNPDSKMKQNLQIGEIFFENGDHYEGELWHDRPTGLGTMTYKDGSKDSGSFGEDGILKVK